MNIIFQLLASAIGGRLARWRLASPITFGKELFAKGYRIGDEPLRFVRRHRGDAACIDPAFGDQLLARAFRSLAEPVAAQRAPGWKLAAQEMGSPVVLHS